jgi:hypothetical protein
MKALLFFLVTFSLKAQIKTEGFVINIKDRSVEVFSPEKQTHVFSVLVDNHSLSDQIGKFMVGHKNLSYVSVLSKKSEVVEIKSDGSAPVVFVPLSPASQEVPLHFGKKAYEIPSKE